MTDKEKIRAEIERRMNKHKYSTALTEMVYAEEDENLLAFIDSMPEEPSCPILSDDLDKLMKEVQKYYSDNFDYITSDQPTLSILTNIARHFTEWQKRKMMEKAVEGYVNYYEDSGGKLMAEAQVGCPYHIGDKVKIIIVKEEQQ